jgi:hypothetical protein
VQPRHVDAAEPRLIGRSLLSRLANGFTGLYRAMSAAQEARAQRMIRPHLARQSDETLRALGFSDGEVKEMRRIASSEPRLWY